MIAITGQRTNEITPPTPNPVLPVANPTIKKIRERIGVAKHIIPKSDP
jgi:hypothetical protein